MRFSAEEQDAIWKIVSAILHLGNIDFDDKKLDNTTPCKIINLKELELVANLLEISIESLSNAILTKTREIGTQIIHSVMPKSDCYSARDSFSKSLYENQFNWLVKRLNNAISSSKYQNVPFESIINDPQRVSIGLLDIFGFEVFKINSFEQLCINFANEKLQQLYVSYVFKAEINEFIEEGLKEFLGELTFQDNSPIIDLMDSSPLGILHLLDESSAISTTDSNLLNNIVKNHKSNAYFKVPKMGKESFIIIHSAKDVEYHTKGFRLIYF